MMFAWLVKFLVCAVLAVLPALPGAARQGVGTTLRFVPHADLSILDPYFTGVYITRNYGYMVYDTLFAMDGQFHPQPQMVDAWKVSVRVPVDRDHRFRRKVITQSGGT